MGDCVIESKEPGVAPVLTENSQYPSQLRRVADIIFRKPKYDTEEMTSQLINKKLHVKNMTIVTNNI